MAMVSVLYQAGDTIHSSKL